ncbi:MAG TPA: hypothetical protein PL037_02780, partial [Elusimicrobiales bacterium]|nr:hypothetical protein [Elusimicrobiales bacterium]
VASDMRKPDGLTVIRPCDLPSALYTLELSDLPGVGARMAERLERYGIGAMRELMELGPAEMSRVWGSVTGEEMWRLLRGEEARGQTSEKKSISHSHVLPPETRDPVAALGILKKLTDKAAVRLRDEGYYASGMHIYAGFIGGPSWKARSFFQETQDTAVFISEADRLWRGLPGGRPMAVGMALTGLVPEAYHAPTLFEDERRSSLMKVLDGVNAKYGKSTLHYAAVPGTKSPMPLRIAFTRIPGKSEI